MKYSVATDTEAYRRVCTSGGFSIGEVEFYNHKIFFKFLCACGKTEYAQAEWSSYMDNLFTSTTFDAAALLEIIGANSVRHLITDGYTDEEIVDLRRGYGDTLEYIRKIRKYISLRNADILLDRIEKV